LTKIKWIHLDLLSIFFKFYKNIITNEKLNDKYKEIYHKI
jgi:hypothetical protein